MKLRRVQQEHSSGIKLHADGTASGALLPADGSGDGSGLIKAVSMKDTAPITTSVGHSHSKYKQ